MLRRGSLIVFSGIDGAGKSTQIERIQMLLEVRGVQVRRVWTRGGYTPIFNTLKRMMRALGRGSLPPPGRTAQRARMFRSGWRRRVWLTVAIADLALYYGLWLRGLKWAGFVVLSDRYLSDTEVDFDLNFPEENVSQWSIWRVLCWLTPSPDVAFMFLVDVEESLARSKEKNEPFPDSLNVLAVRLKHYDQMCRCRTYVRIDGTRPREEITDEIVEAIRADPAR